jgi:dihydropteroate synthase
VTTKILGILNVTPDSFSDGGEYVSVDDALRHAQAMLDDGADIIDVGGESTRPGAGRVDEAEEVRRVLPVVRELAARGVVVSIDTMSARTAEAAIDAGAAMINDVSGGLADDGMAGVAAAADVPFVVMHWRGHSTGMNSLAVYGSVCADVRHELLARVDSLLAAGVSGQRIVLDPGLGFAKNAGHNWELIAHLDELRTLGFPLLVGASRKRFLADALPEGATVKDRDPATAVISALAAAAGAWAVRVHDVRGTRTALAVHEAVRSAHG